VRNGLVTRKEDEFAKQTQVMLLGGGFAEDRTAVEYPVSIQLEARTQALLVEKGASNLQSNFPLGLGYECAFLNLPVPLPRRAICWTGGGLPAWKPGHPRRAQGAGLFRQGARWRLSIWTCT
jgi:hypothetical protein